MTLKETAITVAIAVIFTTFVLVSIDAVYPRPEYNKFCNDSYYYSQPKFAPAAENCSSIQSAEEKKCNENRGMPRYTIDEKGCERFDKCDFCDKEYQDSNKQYTNNFFLIIAPLGALAIIFGVYFAIEFIGTGFMFSGIILMFWGTVQNFDQLNKYTKVIVIFAELLLVMFIAYKKVIPDRNKQSKK